MTKKFIQNLKRGDLIFFNRGTYGSKTYNGRVADIDENRKIIILFINEGKAKPAVYDIPMSGETKFKILPR